MARVRTATTEVSALRREAIESALSTASQVGDATLFYEMVEMRNPSRSYWVKHCGIDISLKAVVTLALRIEKPGVQAKDFHAADAKTRLDKLGFNAFRGKCITPL